MQKRFVGLFIFQLLGLFVATSNAGQGLSYNKVGELYLQSFESIAPEEKPSNEPIDFKNETQLSDRELRSITFSAFASTSDNQPNKKTYSHLETAAKDLNLFSYQSKEQGSEKNSLFSKINNTVTVLGEAVLAKQLANPISNIAQLNKKQAFIKLLLKDEELFKGLDDAVNSIVDDQSGLLYFWKEVDSLEKDSLNSLFFKSDSFLKGLNKSSLAQEVKTRTTMLLDAFPLTLLVTLPFTFYASKHIAEVAKYNRSHGHVDQAAADEDAAKKVLLVGIGGTILAPYVIYLAIPKLRDARNKANYIQRKLMCVAKVLNVFDELQNLLKDNSIATNALSSNATTKDSESTQDFNTLLGLLRTNTFKGNPSFFSWTGRVKAAYSLMQEHKTEFVKFMHFVGEVDAYLSIAKLYKKHPQTKNHYSFVTFANKNAPYIKVQQFWNPMLDAQVAVANSLEFNIGGKGRIAVVTGSNSAGKSTIMINGLTDTLWLAQTLGIAPAGQLTATPFDLIATSMKVQESIMTGQSHFVAEAQHATKLLESIKNLPTDKKAFMAIDELFEGTTAAVGSKALHDFGKSLAQYKNLIAVICTQYQSDPTLLEQETKGICKNYKVDVVKNANGTITRPYLVEEGVSQVSIGAQLLEGAFDTQDEEPDVTDDQFDGDQDQEIDTGEDKEL